MKNNKDGMLGGEYTHEVTNVSKIFGREHDINVVIEGSSAGVDREGNIVYPSIDANARLSDEEIAVSRGYVDHECGHKRHTNIKAFFEYGDRCRAAGEPLKMGIANAMEDPRMEARVIGDYKGSHSNLTATANAVSRSWTSNYTDEVSVCQSTGEPHESWHHFVGGALSILGRHDCWGFEGAGYDRAIESFELLLGQGNMNKCREFSKRIARCDNTQQVLTLADEVGDWVRGQFPQKPQDQDGQDQGQQPQPQGQGKPSLGQDGVDEEDGNKQDFDNDPAQGANDQDAGELPDADQDKQDPGPDADVDGQKDQDQDQDQAQGQDQQGQGQGLDTNGQGKDSSTCTIDQVSQGDPLQDAGQRVEVQKALTQALGKHLTGTWNQYRPLSTRFDKWHTRRDKSGAIARDLKLPEGLTEYQRMLKESAGKLNVIRRKLERALQADRSVQWDGGQQFGRLDSRRLVAAFNRQEKVYKRKQEAPAHDTAVTFLLDMSYSMSDSRIETAVQTLICMAEALEKTSIQYNILGHTIRRDEGSFRKMRQRIEEMRDQGVDMSRFSRITPLDMFEFKSFNERLGHARKPLGNVPALVNNSSDWCGNADSEAVWHSYKKLSRRGERRKVLIVLSDGRPNTCHGGIADNGEAALRKTVKEVEGRGVEVIGVGIQSDKGNEYYKNWHTVLSLDDLAETVIDELGATLMGKHVKGVKS
nr:hypothetical protein [Endozoicomonas sp.]